MFEEGLTILCAGMGVVFGFLVVMVFAMFTLGKVMQVINKWMPIETVVAAPKKVATAGANEDIAVAIAMAITRK